MALRYELFSIIGITIALAQCSYAKPTATHKIWNFTKHDYQKLIQRGGTLRFHADSEWFSEPLKENLLATLNYLLDPNLTPASTRGVNLKDFFHGHLACEIPNKIKSVPKQVIDRFNQVTNISEFHRNEVPEEMDLAAYIKLVKKAERATHWLVETILKSYCARPIVIYHTFEYSRPTDMDFGDPRRNIATRMKDMTPFHFTPPDPRSAGSWDRVYSNIFQFAFLIDSDGVIHVTWGSEPQLSRVTGNREKG
jgi:hypothetical protein